MSEGKGVTFILCTTLLIDFLAFLFLLCFIVAVGTAADAMVFCLAGTLAVYFGIGAPWVVLAGGIFGAILCDDALSLGQALWCDIVNGGASNP